MGRRSWLDSIVYRFQHHWETNPQYRAAVSGVVGLVLILSLCTCMGVLNRTAGAALAAVGFGTGDAGPLGTPNTGTNKVGCCNSFPTPTVLYPTNGPAPHATVPESQTPPPYATATEAPTPTDTPNPGGGGGGGGGGGACNGNGGSTTWVFDPCPAKHGNLVTLTINATGFGGKQMSLEVKWGETSVDTACFWFFQPPNGGITLPPNGIWTNSYTIPADCNGPVSGVYMIQGGPSAVISGPSV